MNNFSILIGGKAGDGINQAGLLLARLLAQLGWRIYIYIDYPSLIRGGHNFAIVRACQEKVSVHNEKVDILLALNQDAVEFHKWRLKDSSEIIYDSDVVKSGKGIGLPITTIVKEENGQVIMRNSCIIGAFAKSVGIEWELAEKVLRKDISKKIDLNLKLARKGYDGAKELLKIESFEQKSLPLLTGNEAIGLGLVNAGLDAYVAYPMTPSSGTLHFLAANAEEFDLKVFHPENEIGVMLTALGFSYAGERVAVGTSGGGFCLMTEGLSLSGMAELPVVVMVSQRPGPSTGVPTYTSQADLNFVLNAGQGEFARFVVAPSDAEQAFYWTGKAMNIAWKYQVPSIILSDKTLSEGTYSFDIDSVEEIKEEPALLWDRSLPYKRYLNTDSGISPLAFPLDKDVVVKVNSYEHDEDGITAEEPDKVKKGYEKRLRKEESLAKELESYETVKVYGEKNSGTALLCWGSNAGVCVEAGEKLGLKIIQPIVLLPFPVKQLQQALKGVKELIAVENNSTAQLVRFLKVYGFEVQKKILKYDGRPFSVEELEKRISEIRGCNYE